MSAEKKGFLRWYRKAARIEADREVPVPARPYRKGRGIVLNQYGLASFFALFVMVLFCVNYSSNAGLICACLLTLAWVCAIFANHWVIARVSLERVITLSGDEDNPGEIELLWRIASSVRPVFWLTVDGQVARLVFDENGWARVRWKPLPRASGRFAFPTIRVSTAWPMSIGFSWFIMRPQHDIVIAPAAPNHIQESGQYGDTASNLLATSGDPEGIRPRNPQDVAARWAWKPTVRLGRPMTYEWSQSGKDIVRVVWNEEIAPPIALRQVRAELSAAVSAGQSFQIYHPWGASTVLQGEQAALSQVCLIGSHALPRQQWGPVPPPPPGMIRRLVNRMISRGDRHG